ncbi:MAG: ammonium transporter [Verrucomicrobiae bacterium]|nr:ammonium transporter [Verrucomicrobiae bacterium]
MKKIKQYIWLLAIAAMCVAATGAFAQTAAPAAPAAEPAPAAAPAEPAGPTDSQRITDIENYFKNLGVGGSGDTTWKSNIGAMPGPGHNAWLMVSAALVLFMTLPGLALFYGGLVRKKNVLSVLAQCLGITGLVAILWWAVGYSLVFGKNFDSPFLGGSEFFFFKGVDSAPNTDYAYWVSQNVFAMYQLMFAIITPALIVGAIAERMKFSAVLLFVGAWMFLVYFPLAHMIWGVTGLMNGVWNAKAAIASIDFAGGTVVHMSSGWSALVLCLILGPRLGFGKEPMPPHSMVLCMVGTGMLWVGWYGFNAGSALAADYIASNAFMTTTLAAAVASFTWAVVEYIFKGKSSILGFCSGAVAGLVVITPAAGFVNATASIIIGIIAGVVPFLACHYLKSMLKYDDALDTFGIHAVGGTIGAFVTGIFATSAVNTNITDSAMAAGSNGLKGLVENGGLWMAQCKAIVLTIIISVVATAIIAYVIKAVIGLRPTPEAEREGLDTTDHGEEGYIH